MKHENLKIDSIKANDRIITEPLVIANGLNKHFKNIDKYLNI